MIYLALLMIVMPPLSMWLVLRSYEQRQQLFTLDMVNQSELARKQQLMRVFEWYHSSLALPAMRVLASQKPPDDERESFDTIAQDEYKKATDSAKRPQLKEDAIESLFKQVRTTY